MKSNDLQVRLTQSESHILYAHFKNSFCSVRINSNGGHWRSISNFILFQFHIILRKSASMSWTMGDDRYATICHCPTPNLRIVYGLSLLRRRWIVFILRKSQIYLAQRCCCDLEDAKQKQSRAHANTLFFTNNKHKRRDRHTNYILYYKVFAKKVPIRCNWISVTPQNVQLHYRHVFAVRNLNALMFGDR